MRLDPIALLYERAPPQTLREHQRHRAGDYLKIYELAAVRRSLLEMAEIANDSPTTVLNSALPALSWLGTLSGLKQVRGERRPTSKTREFWGGKTLINVFFT